MCSNKREILCLHIGETGAQIGNSFWNSLCSEYNLKLDGKPTDPSSVVSEKFFENADKKYTPRALFFDTDADRLNKTKNGNLKDILNKNNFVLGSKGKAKDYFQSFDKEDKKLGSEITEKLRKAVEACSSFEGFITIRSVGGNTGSGMGNLVLDMTNEFEKKLKLDYRIYPNMSDLSEQATLNSMLSTSFGLTFYDFLSVCSDRASLKLACSKNLGISNPSVSDLNDLSGYVLASLTSSMRHGGVLNGGLTEMQKNLIPFPRLSNVVPSVAPLISEGKKNSASTEELTSSLFLPNNQLFNNSDKLSDGRYIASYLSYQGQDFSLADIDKAIQALEAKMKFADFATSGFRICLNSNPPFATKKIFNNKKSVFALTNSTHIAESFKKLNERYDKFSSKYSSNEAVSMTKEEMGYLVEGIETYKKDYEEFQDF